jgi:hypothetical protein
MVVTVEYWCARRVDALCHTSSLKSKLKACKTSQRVQLFLTPFVLSLQQEYQRLGMHRPPAPGHSANATHYSRLPTVRLVAPATIIGDLEMGISDLRVRFARYSHTDIIDPASPNHSGTIAA